MISHYMFLIRGRFVLFAHKYRKRMFSPLSPMMMSVILFHYKNSIFAT